MGATDRTTDLHPPSTLPPHLPPSDLHPSSSLSDLICSRLIGIEIGSATDLMHCSDCRSFKRTVHRAVIFWVNRMQNDQLNRRKLEITTGSGFRSGFGFESSVWILFRLGAFFVATFCYNKLFYFNNYRGFASFKRL